MTHTAFLWCVNRRFSPSPSLYSPSLFLLSRWTKEYLKCCLGSSFTFVFDGWIFGRACCCCCSSFFSSDDKERFLHSSHRWDSFGRLARRRQRLADATRPFRLCLCVWFLFNYRLPKVLAAAWRSSFHSAKIHIKNRRGWSLPILHMVAQCSFVVTAPRWLCVRDLISR